MKILINEKLSEHKYKTPEGYLICVDSVLARTGKQTYRRNEVFGDSDDDSEIEIDRPAKEVFSDATLASFENKPITVEHPDEDVNAENYKDYAVGFVRDVHRGTDNGMDVIVGTLVITDAKTIEEIENGEHTDLSCGYDCDIIDEENPQQRNIRGNHVALCAQGRAGNARIVDTAVKDYNSDNHAPDLMRKIEKNFPEGEVNNYVSGNQRWHFNVYDVKLNDLKSFLKTIGYKPYGTSMKKDNIIIEFKTTTGYGGSPAIYVDCMDAKLLDSEIKDMRLPPKWKKDIQRILHARSTFTKRDIDVSEIVNEIERYMKIDGHPLTLERERINGWNKMSDGMMRKDYTFGIRGYDDKILISLYADPDTWKVTEVNGYFRDSIEEETMEDAKTLKEYTEGFAVMPTHEWKKKLNGKVERYEKTYEEAYRQYNHLMKGDPYTDFVIINCKTKERQVGTPQTDAQAEIEIKDKKRNYQRTMEYMGYKIGITPGFVVETLLDGDYGFYTLEGAKEAIRRDLVLEKGYKLKDEFEEETGPDMEDADFNDAQHTYEIKWMDIYAKSKGWADYKHHDKIKAGTLREALEKLGSSAGFGVGTANMLIINIHRDDGRTYTYTDRLANLLKKTDLADEINDKEPEWEVHGVYRYKPDGKRTLQEPFTEYVNTRNKDEAKRKVKQMFEKDGLFGIQFSDIIATGDSVKDEFVLPDDSFLKSLEKQFVQNGFRIETKLKDPRIIMGVSPAFIKGYTYSLKVAKQNMDIKEVKSYASKLNKIAAWCKQNKYNTDVKVSARNDGFFATFRIDGLYKRNDSVKDELVEPDEKILKELERKLSAFKFMVESKKKNYFGGYHYQVRVPGHSHGKPELQFYHVQLGKIEDMMQRYGYPMTHNIGIDSEGRITAGLDIREKYVKE